MTNPKQTPDNAPILRGEIAMWKSQLQTAANLQERIALLEQIGIHQGALGDPAAVLTFNDAVKAAQEAGDQLAETLNTLRLAATMQHLNQTGMEAYSRALELCRQQQMSDDCLQALGDYYVKLGRVDEAVSLFEEALTLRQVKGDMERITVTSRALAAARKLLTPEPQPASVAQPAVIPPLPVVSLIERISYRSYAVVQLLLFIPLIALLALVDGFSTGDFIVLIGLLVVTIAIQRLRRTRATPQVNEFEELQARLHNGAKYTLVELYGTYCVGCVAVNPLVDSLEAEGNPRLQVLRLDIESPPGQYLKPEKNTFTPMFMLYDPHGNKIRETYLVLDRSRILYEVERLSRGSGPLVMP